MSTTLLEIDGRPFTVEYARKQMHRHSYFTSPNWEDCRDIDTSSIEWFNAVEQCQSHHQIAVDADLGDMTARVLSACYCGVPNPPYRPSHEGLVPGDRKRLFRGGGCQWPQADSGETEITYHSYMAGVKGMNVDRAEELVDLAARRWNVTSGINFRRTNNASSANVIIRMWNLGAGTLGLAQLPCGVGSSAQLFLRLAKRVNWEKNDNGDLAEVIGHEFGHTGGHEHEDGEPSLMTTYATGVYWFPQEIDKRRSVIRYGVDTHAPASPPTPVPHSRDFTMIGTLYDESGNELGPYEMELRPRSIGPLGD